MNKEMFREAQLLIPMLILAIITVVYLAMIIIAIIFMPNASDQNETVVLLLTMGLMGLIGLWMLVIIPEFKDIFLKLITFILTLSGVLSASIIVIWGFVEEVDGIFLIFNCGLLILIVMAIVYSKKLFAK